MRGGTGLWLGLLRGRTTATSGPPPSVVSVTGSPSTAVEGSTYTFTVVLSSAHTTTFSVPFALGGTAVPGSDYLVPPSCSHGVTVSGSLLIIPAGVSSFTLTITSIDDTIINGARTLTVTVGAMSDTVTITDNDAPSGMPLDSLIPGWYFWCYALRRLRTAYTGPLVRVRRTSDNAELDIGFTASGQLDVATLLSFVGSADGRVVVWYNQSGITGYDLTSFGGTGGSRQPLLVQGGVLQTLPNGAPAIRWDPAPAPNARNLSWANPFGMSVFGVWVQAAFTYEMIAPPALFPYYSRLASFANTRGGSDVDDPSEIALARMRTFSSIPRIAHERSWTEYNLHVIPDLTVAHRVMASLHTPTQTAELWFDGATVGTTTHANFATFSGSNYFRLGSGETGGSASEMEQWSGLIAFVMITIPEAIGTPPPAANLSLVNAFMASEYGTP